LFSFFFFVFFLIVFFFFVLFFLFFCFLLFLFFFFFFFFFVNLVELPIESYTPISFSNHANNLLFCVWHLQDVSTSNLPGVHQLVDLRQLLEIDGLEGSVDHTTGEKIQGFCAVLPVADV